MTETIMAAAVVVLGVTAGARPADACGGGGGGGSGGGGGGGGGGSSCTDSTDVVGYRHCTTFGAWSKTTQMPLLIFEVGMSVQRFDSPADDESGSLDHENEHFTYRVTNGGSSTGGADPRTTAVVSNLRVGIAPTSHLYLAGEFELGGLASSPDHAEMTSTGMHGSPEFTRASAVAFGALAAVGIQGGRGRVLAGVELVGGVRGVSYTYHSKYLACEQDVTVTTAHQVLEARARASTWISPMLSVGAQVGSSVIDRGDWNVGVFLGGYTRAFADTHR